MDRNPHNAWLWKTPWPECRPGKSAGMAVAAIPDPHFADARDYEGKADFILTRLGEVLGVWSNCSHLNRRKSAAVMSHNCR
jgi:hypothetical protein